VVNSMMFGLGKTVPPMWTVPAERAAPQPSPASPRRQ
jgi:hypothetical protein